MLVTIVAVLGDVKTFRVLASACIIRKVFGEENYSCALVLFRLCLPFVSLSVCFCIILPVSV